MVPGSGATNPRRRRRAHSPICETLTLAVSLEANLGRAPADSLALFQNETRGFSRQVGERLFVPSLSERSFLPTGTAADAAQGRARGAEVAFADCAEVARELGEVKNGLVGAWALWKYADLKTIVLQDSASSGGVKALLDTCAALAESPPGRRPPPKKSENGASFARSFAHSLGLLALSLYFRVAHMCPF